MAVLVDTSVWIDFFKRDNPLDLSMYVEPDEIVTCLPVIQEILQGFSDEGVYRLAKSSLFSLPILETPISQVVFEEAVDLYRIARRQGYTIRSSVDCLIAACALRNDVLVLHRDRDFSNLALVSSLRQQSV
ncbi:MAG: PIN domain-containing protein [Deltaproteobacteria bacterium]|nr:PIN domain-containing protein [Deltaproteobacteria bacterium]